MHDSAFALADTLCVLTQFGEWPPSELKAALSFLSPHPTSAIARDIDMIKFDGFICDMMRTSRCSGVRGI
jgi:hypothetical protein